MLSIAKTLSLSFGLALSIAATATAGGPGQSQGPITAYGPGGYLSTGDSLLFTPGCDRPGIEYYFEDFEDGLLNTTGLIIPPVHREILAPGANTDSVDTNGRSLRATVASSGSITLNFVVGANDLPDYPAEVGFTITDTNGAANTTFTLFVTDGNNNLATFNFSNIGDGSAVATQDDDVFFGVTSPNGIKQIQVSSPTQLWEMDHIQYTKTTSVSLPARGDTDGTGTGDLLFHQPGSKLTAWFMDDLIEDPTVLANTLGSSWLLQGVGDLDGDCDDDMVWRNGASGGKIQAWIMENGVVIQKKDISTTLGAAWVVRGVNDFDGNGTADLFLENDAGKLMRIWFMNGSSIAQNSLVTLSGFDPSLYTVQTTGDVNADGYADIVWRRNSNGDLRYFKMAGATVLQNKLLQGALATTWQPLGGGDLDGDGDLDLAFRSSASGNVLFMLLTASGTVQSTAQVSLASGFSFVGFPDVNGDGRADLVWRRDSDGLIVRWKMNGVVVQNSATVGTSPNTSGTRSYAEK